MCKRALSEEGKKRLREAYQSLHNELLRFRADYLAGGHTAEEWNDMCEAIIARHKPLNVNLVKGIKIWDWRRTMKRILSNIGEALLWPFAELAGALVMRELRRWAKRERRMAQMRIFEASAQHAGISLRRDSRP